MVSTIGVLKVFDPIQHQESGPVHELNLIHLSSWEWFGLLSIVILIVWLLILFQVRSTSVHELGLESNVVHEDSTGNDVVISRPDKSDQNHDE